jgi:threonine aldolase
MADAAVGDDVFGEDPTVTSLERHIADLSGKESGLFVPSGTMSNLIAMSVHCQGLFSEALAGDASHIALYECGGSASVGRAFVRQLPTEDDGTIKIDVLRGNIQPANIHHTKTKVIALENTHNAKGGKVLPQPYVEEVAALCREHSIKFHCDGARIWNAAVAQKRSVRELLTPYDTASLCLSKGLGAPVGSVLVGSSSFIADARHLRKLLGGGMRQAGILAAAGLFAVQNRFGRLHEDHAMAYALAQGLEKLGFAVIKPDSNIVIWKMDPAERDPFLKRCEERGLKLVAMGATGNVRAIPHFGNTMEDVHYALQVIEGIVGGKKK